MGAVEKWPNKGGGGAGVKRSPVRNAANLNFQFSPRSTGHERTCAFAQGHFKPIE